MGFYIDFSATVFVESTTEEEAIDKFFRDKLYLSSNVEYVEIDYVEKANEDNWEEEEDEEGILDKFDTELILQTAICRIGEFSHVDKKTGKVVSTYEKLIEDIQEMMCEVDIPI